MVNYAGQSSSFYAATGGVPVEGAWYSGRRYLNGQLLAPGEYEPGKVTSNEVIAQTNPDNVAYVQSERVKANELQVPTQISLSSSTAQNDYITGLMSQVDQARSAVEDFLSRQQSEVDAKLEVLKTKEQDTLGKIGTLVNPFREDIENTERERLQINKNFEENQVLIDELDSLLSEGNDLIRQQQEVTGLAAVRNPRIQKAMDDVAARAGVIQAVINARNGQIAVAENLIDRTINAIVGDRADQISYYQTILDLNRQDIISLDSQSQKIAEEQLGLKKMDLERTQASADYIKQLLIDPATAGLMGEAGVKLTDSVETINAKLTQTTYAREVKDMSNEMVLNGAQAVINPASVPKDELRVLTDSRGVKHYYQVKEDISGWGSGTASERAVKRITTSISDQSLSFPDVVVSYANQLSLSEIYSAYTQSAMGQKWGRPNESANEIALLYKWARGEITESEYRAALEGE